MTDSRNTILAVILSGLVLLVWQYFYVAPAEKKRAEQTQTQVVNPAPNAANTTPQTTAPGGAATASLPPGDAVNAAQRPKRQADDD